MEEKMNSLKKTARIAGLWYILLVILGIYGFRYVQSQIYVGGNAAATISNILAHQFLFSTGIVSSIAVNFIYIFLVLALYRLLKQVNERSAQLMVVLVLVQVPISVVVELFNFTALMILKGEVMKALEPAQKQDFAMLFLKVHNYGLALLEVFWGIWLIPLGQLVYRSGFTPWVIGVLLIIGGAAYMADSFVFVLFPDLDPFVSKFIIVASLGEIAIMLWLLIIGAKVQKPKIDF